jgi:mannose-6-phosphate isomerase
MYPMILKPALKDYIWGGQRLKTEFNKQCEYTKLAESWELSCHKDGLSIIDNGEHKGKLLLEYINSDRQNILGTKCEKFNNFPILIKLIDAKDNLSIQVHPGDEYALKNEGQYGKNEMWYVIEANPDSFIYYGFNRDISPEEFKERIKNNSFLETLNKVKVKNGDTFFIESGTIHAIGGGILLAEVQQNSNLTYRVYDYNRLGNDGKPRELHVDKAAEVINFNKKLVPEFNISLDDKYNKMKLISSCEYFSTYKIMVDNVITLETNGEAFHCLVNLEGKFNIKTDTFETEMEKGQTVFIPANLEKYEVEGNGELLFITI